MISISPVILSKAKKTHVIELSNQIESKLQVVSVALNYLNNPRSKKNIANFEKDLKNTKLDFNIIKSSLNWFLKSKTKKRNTIVEGYDSLDNFFKPSFHRANFTTDIIDEIRRCLLYFDNSRVVKILDSRPKDLIDVEIADFVNFSSKKNSNNEKEIRGRLIGFIFNYGSFRVKSKRYDAYDLTNNLEVEACLYCNRGYASTIISNSNKIIRPELDHFFAQSIYPILALSFFNLIPSCHSCNSNLKGSIEFTLADYFHPYLSSFDQHNIVFKYRPGNASDFYPGVDDHLKVKLITSKIPAKFIKRVENNIGVFKLNDIYSSHELLVKELQKLKQKSNATYLESLRTKVFVKSDGTARYKTAKEVFTTVMLNYYKPTDYHKRPMAKFLKDISLDLKII